MPTPKYICIDFDGTMVLHNWPYIGEEVPYSVYIVKKLVKHGHKIILHTMRDGIQLDEAIEWCRNRDIRFDYINENPEKDTSSRKVYANIYIDDHSIGAPLILNQDYHPKPFVDWKSVECMLIKNNILCS